jgi:hypothetical protein
MEGFAASNNQNDCTKVMGTSQLSELINENSDQHELKTFPTALNFDAIGDSPPISSSLCIKQNIK